MAVFVYLRYEFDKVIVILIPLNCQVWTIRNGIFQHRKFLVSNVTLVVFAWTNLFPKIPNLFSLFQSVDTSVRKDFFIIIYDKKHYRHSAIRGRLPNNHSKQFYKQSRFRLSILHHIRLLNIVSKKTKNVIKLDTSGLGDAFQYFTYQNFRRQPLS